VWGSCSSTVQSRSEKPHPTLRPALRSVNKGRKVYLPIRISILRTVSPYLNWDKDFHTTDFATKDFDTILKIKILFYYFEAIPIYIAFCKCLQSAPCRHILNSNRALMPRRCHRLLAPLIASLPPDLLVPIYLPFYIFPFLVFLIIYKLEAGDN
jgi:hypothetical protein